MIRHKVTRKCKSGKTTTYWRGSEGSRRFGDGAELSKKFSESRIRKVNEAYTDKGITPPEGKGIHTVAFHERATAIMGSMKKSGKKVDKGIAYAIAMKQLGKNKAVLKGHRRSNGK